MPWSAENASGFQHALHPPISASGRKQRIKRIFRKIIDPSRRKNPRLLLKGGFGDVAGALFDRTTTHRNRSLPP
jgi:hypothetical protein